MKHLLLFDHLEGNYHFLRDILAQDPQGYKVDWTSSFHEALHELVNGTYDLFILSYESGGLQLLNAVRKDKERIPAFLLTRYEDERLFSRAQELGSLDGVALHNLRFDTLVRKIKNGLRVADHIRANAERDERLRIALKAAKMVAWDWDVVRDELRYSSEPTMVTGRVSYGLRHKFSTFLGYVHPEDRDKVDASIQAVLKEGTDYEFEYRIRGTDSAIRWVRSAAKVFRGVDGKPLRMTGIVLDITEKHEAAEKVIRLNEDLEERVRQRTSELEASNRELEAFSYSVSHDLRVPLQAIYGFIEIILSTQDINEATERYLRRTLRQAERMSTLIDDLLALSRVTRQKVAPEAINLSELYSTIFRDRAYEQPFRNVHVDIDPHMHIQGDVRMIRVAIENLFNNAWKYSGKREEAVIRVGALVSQNQNIYYIKDNGAGFDSEKADNLFMPFQRYHTDREFQGTGIGLATVARVIQRHGGSLVARSRVNEGAAFAFSLLEPIQSPENVLDQLSNISVELLPA